MKRILAVTLFLLSLGGITHADEPQRGGRLVIGSSTTFLPLSPFESASTFSANILEMVFGTLVTIDESFHPFPAIAASWESSEDLKQWTFRLHPGIVFHDGHPLTAEDVRFTFETLQKSPRAPFPENLDNIARIESLGSDEVRFTLSRSDQSFLILLSQVAIAPSHLYDAEGRPRQPDLYERPIGSGPFRVRAFSSTKAHLEAFDRYYLGRPYLDKVVFEAHSGERALLSSLISGKTDIKFFHHGKYENLTLDIPDLTVIPYKNLYLYGVYLNLKSPLFADRKVRQALNFAIDKQKILARAKSHGKRVAVSPVPPTHPDANTSLTPYPFDPKKATTLLSEAGWSRETGEVSLKKNGKAFAFKILLAQGGAFENEIIRLLQEQFDRVGIQTEVEALPLDQLIQRVFARKDFDAALFFFNNVHGVIADRIYWQSGTPLGFNFTSYANLEVDLSLEEAGFGADPRKSREAYGNFQKLIHEDPPMVYLLWKDFPLAVNKRVRGLRPEPHQMFRTLDRVWVEGR